MRHAADLLPAASWWQKLFSFALVSLTGLVIDTGLFLVEVRLGVDPFVANMVSAGAGVTFVYFASVGAIFQYQGRWLVQLFAAYLAYQMLGVLAASAAIAWLIGQGLHPLLAKIAILPITFSCNYLFMRLLTRSWIPASTGQAK